MTIQEILRSKTWILLMCVSASLLGGTAAYADHWSHNGWYHEHLGYPAVPTNSNQLVNRFGQPCSSDAHFNRNVTWTGQVAGGGVQTFTPDYHKRLGGDGHTGFFARTGGTSTNMEDVVGHLGDDHKLYGDSGAVKGGVWGYYCRYISNTTKWSSHAWGVAIDINASYENYPDADCQPNSFGTQVANKWTNHNWYWGANFPPGTCDPMHFQYVTNY